MSSRADEHLGVVFKATKVTKPSAVTYKPLKPSLASRRDYYAHFSVLNRFGTVKGADEMLLNLDRILSEVEANHYALPTLEGRLRRTYSAPEVGWGPEFVRFDAVSPLRDGLLQLVEFKGIGLSQPPSTSLLEKATFVLEGLPGRVVEAARMLADLGVRLVAIRGDLGEAGVTHAGRLASYRAEYFLRNPAHDVADFAQRAGLTVSDLADRVAVGDVLMVPFGGRLLVPDFQLAEDGTVLGAVRSALLPLWQRFDSEWEIAGWFDATNQYLGGRRPIDLLREDPDAVISAADRGSRRGGF